MRSKYRTWKYWRDEWVSPIIVAVVIAAVIRTFIVQPFKIPSTSMYPTLKVKDRIFVNKFLYGARIPVIGTRTPALREPGRGDIIVFLSVEDPPYPSPQEDYARLIGPVFFNKARKRFRWYAPRYLVKRLIGLPGDTIEIRGENVYVNGEILKDPFAVTRFSYFNVGPYGREGEAVTVPDDSYFVLGDNSANSVDSRYWGFVPKKNMTGKVFVIWWPLNRIRLVR